MWLEPKIRHPLEIYKSESQDSRMWPGDYLPRNDTNEGLRDCLSSAIQPYSSNI